MLSASIYQTVSSDSLPLLANKNAFVLKLLLLFTILFVLVCAYARADSTTTTTVTTTIPCNQQNYPSATSLPMDTAISGAYGGSMIQNRYVDVPASYSTSGGSITVSAWINGASWQTGSDRGSYIAGDYGNNFAGIELYVDNNGHPVFRVASTSPASNEYTAISTSSSISTNAWHFVVGVYPVGTGNTVLYVDGSSVGADTGTHLGTATTDFYIGKEGWANYGYFNGRIADVQVYRSALSSDQVTALYNEGSGGAPLNGQSNVGWWPLIKDYNDYSGYGNNGATLTSSPISTFSQQATPVISSVLSDNLGLSNSNSGAGWLITCPATPDPTKTQEYFSSSRFVLGNACLADPSPLSATATINAPFVCNSISLANATVHLSINNIGRGAVYNLGYSGTTNYPDKGLSDISSSYDSASYIFGQAPFSPQYGLWAWTGEYADLSSFLPVSVSVQNSLALTGPSNCGSPVVCNYPYTYNAFVSLSYLQNANVPVQSAVSGGNYLVANGQVYTGLQSWQGAGDNLCAWRMAQAGGPINSGGVPSYAAPTCDYTQVQNMNNVWIMLNGQYYDSVSVLGGNEGLTVYRHCNYDRNYGCIGSACIPDEIDCDVDNGDPNFYIITGYSNVYATGGYTAMEVNSMNVISQWFTVNALPYLLYDLSMPATYSSLNNNEQFLNLSFDLYSTQNFMSPKGRLGDLALYTDSGFFAKDTSTGQLESLSGALTTTNIKNALASSFGTAAEVFSSSLTSNPQNAAGAQGKTLGAYLQFKLTGPAYISSAPDDNIYVLTTASSSSFSIIASASQSSYLYKLRYIPSGYYNLTSYNPGSISSNSLDWNTWNSIWRSFWQNSGLQQNPDLYVTAATAFTTATCSSFLGTGLFGSCSGGGAAVIPFAMGSDYADDVFVLAKNVVSSGSNWNPNGFDLIEMPSNSQVAITDNKAPEPSSNNNFMPDPEFAVSPSGQYVYVASLSDNSVYLYRSPSGSQNPSGSGAQSSGFAYAGKISLSYSNTSYDLDLAGYLKNGCRFGNTLIANTYSSAPKCDPTSGTNCDTGSNHHPVAIANLQGIVYVLDNWTFTVNYNSGGAQMRSAILMLRAFYNGTEVSVDGSPNSYSVVIPGSSQPPSNGKGAPSNGFRPYGWPMSATISIHAPSNGGSSSGSNPQPSELITYCAFNCTYTPSTLTASYEPIGPQIRNDGYANGFGFSTDYNGTAYIIARPNDMFDDSYNNGLTLSSQTYVGYPTYGGVSKHMYTELASFKISLANYTHISLGADEPYVCYVDTYPDTNNGIQYPSTPCVLAYGSSVLTNMGPPVLGVPSAFYYVAGEGTPAQYLSLQSSVSAGMPSGASNYNSQAKTEASTGQVPEGNNAFVTPNSLDLAPPSSTASVPTVLPAVYINSVITGNLLVPYCAEYALTQKWIFGTPFVSSTDGSTPSASCSCGSPPSYTNPGLGISWPTDYSSWSTKGTVSNTITTDICTTAKVPMKSNYVNETIEGGATYMQLTPSLKYYDGNLSDASSIELPYLNYNLFSSRIFGEAYVNLTVNPSNYHFYDSSACPGGYVLASIEQTDYCVQIGVFSCPDANVIHTPYGPHLCGYQYTSGISFLPIVVNAVQAYDYQYGSLVQEVPGVGTFYGYEFQQAIPSNPANPPTNVLLGTNCGSSCPANYYYTYTDAVPASLFDGSTSYISTSHSYSQQGEPITISAWIYSTNWASGSDRGRYIAGDYGGNYKGAEFYVNTAGHLNFGVASDSPQGEYTITSSTPLSTNTWYFVTGTFDGTTVRLYINGASAATPISGHLATATTGFYMGRAEWVNAAYFSGYITNVQVYGTALSDANVLSLFNEGNGGAPLSNADTLGYWPLGTSPYDYSGSGNDGVAYGVSYSNAYASGSLMNYAAATYPYFVSIGSVYAQTSQLDTMILDQTSNPSVLGYNRLIYTFVDTFNNIIYAPFDTDFAYPTQITLDPSVSISDINANESIVSLTGTVTYTTLSGAIAPLANNDIYLYYNLNMNYYDPTNSPSGGPTTQSTAASNYYAHSLLCAFNPPSTTGCQLANPLYTVVQGSPSGNPLLDVGAVEYNPEYNGLSQTATSPLQCNPMPSSLLAVSNIVYNCNLNGVGMSAMAYNTQVNNYRYCLPYTLDGNGLLTSQMGLIAKVTTDTNGNFNYQFTACGNGNNQVFANYYGWPPPQPLTIVQPPIPQSSGVNERSPSYQTIPSNEFTYIVAPDQVTAGITIGAFALSMFNLDWFAIMSLAAIVVFIIAFQRKKIMKTSL